MPRQNALRATGRAAAWVWGDGVGAVERYAPARKVGAVFLVQILLMVDLVGPEFATQYARMREGGYRLYIPLASSCCWWISLTSTRAHATPGWAWAGRFHARTSGKGAGTRSRSRQDIKGLITSVICWPAGATR